MSTSSTTRTRSASLSVKPRRSVSAPSCRSANSARTLQRPRDFLADDDAAERRRQDGRRLQVPGAVGQRRAELLGEIGILQHQRALQVALAVQPGRQPEVPLEKCP